MFRREGEVVEPSLLDFALQEGVAAAGVATPKEQVGLAWGEGVEASGRIGGTIGLPIGLSITVERGPAIVPVGDGDMNQLGRAGLFGGTADILRADAVITPRHPTLGLLFREDNGVEDLAADRLHRQHAPAALGQGGQEDPGFHGLGREVFGGGRGFREGAFAVEAESAIADAGTALWLGGEFADEVAAIFFEGPPVNRDRAGILSGLKPPTERVARQGLLQGRHALLEFATFAALRTDAAQRGG